MIFIWLQVWLHFHFYIIETGRKSLRLQAMPTKNPPNTSYPAPEIIGGRKVSIVRNSTSKLDTPKIYKSLNKLHTCELKLKRTGWIINEAESDVTLNYSELLFHLSKNEIVIDDRIGFTVIVYGLRLPDDHVLYKKYKQLMGNVTASNLIYDLQKHFFYVVVV